MRMIKGTGWIQRACDDGVTIVIIDNERVNMKEANGYTPCRASREGRYKGPFIQNRAVVIPRIPTVHRTRIDYYSFVYNSLCIIRAVSVIICGSDVIRLHLIASDIFLMFPQFYYGGTRSQREHNCINVPERILFVLDFKLIDRFTDGLLFKSYINIRNGHVTIMCI